MYDFVQYEIYRVLGPLHIAKLKLLIKAYKSALDRNMILRGLSFFTEVDPAWNIFLSEAMRTDNEYKIFNSVVSSSKALKCPLDAEDSDKPNTIAFLTHK